MELTGQMKKATQKKSVQEKKTTILDDLMTLFLFLTDTKN